MIDIAYEQLARATGAGGSPRGTPIFGRIGWYEQLKNFGGQLNRRVISPKGKAGKWLPYHPVWPNYEGQ